MIEGLSQRTGFARSDGEHGGLGAGAPATSMPAPMDQRFERDAVPDTRERKRLTVQRLEAMLDGLDAPQMGNLG